MASERLKTVWIVVYVHCLSCSQAVSGMTRPAGVIESHIITVIETTGHAVSHVENSGDP